MGRTKPSLGAPPPAQRKDARAKRAKQTINKDIPALLQAYPRAKRGIDASELIVDPPVPTTDAGPSTPKSTTPQSQLSKSSPKLTLKIADTLDAAANLITSNKHRKVCILNMASALRPGGGFLNGATSQEESLCMRSTLYPALREEFYRLPEVGGIFTPDVLVFRSVDGVDLTKSEHFFVDVISAAMLRDPDVEEVDGEKVYADAKDRSWVRRKMEAVLRIARTKKVKRLVLGAWGCGAYRNPVREIARAWRDVLLSLDTGIETYVAIKERGMALAFADAFGDNLVLEEVHEDPEHSGADDDGDMELETKIADLEAQIKTARSPVLKERLQTILSKLKDDQGG